VSRYQKGKTNLDFTGARDSRWQWHQLGHMQVCTSLQTDNPASTPPLSFLQAGCPSCRPTNSVKALQASAVNSMMHKYTCSVVYYVKHIQTGIKRLFCLSVRLSHQSTAAVAGGFAAERRAGRRCQLIAASAGSAYQLQAAQYGTQQQTC